MSALLKTLTSTVSESLGVTDEAETIAQFIHSLYSQIDTLDPYKSKRLESFHKILKDNGGDEFPEDFVTKVFTIIDLEEIPKKEKKEKEEPKKEYNEAIIEPKSSVEFHDSKDFKREPRSIREFKKEPKQPEPVATVGEIYRGYVSSVAPYGAFVRLNSPTSFQSGLCHISQISFVGKRVHRVEDIVRPNQEVFVKVLLVEGHGNRKKISLSMRGIDQATGLDKSEEIEMEKTQERGRDEHRGVKRRLTSPERWEIRQLIASGVAKALDYPELNDETNTKNDNETESNDDIQVDVELKTAEPTFLKGQVQSADLEPLKIMKNPEGSMSRAAMNGSTLAKNFKEERLKAQKEQEKARKEKSVDSRDPLARTKQQNDTNSVISEWKKSQMSSNVSYGKRTSMSIKEQRESLPVYSMRSQLVEAVRNNQFLVIVGETGSGKTTQIVQYLMEEGFNTVDGSQKIIGCTQPRRVAAVSVAKRVSQEVGCKLGQEVGYNIRFEDVTSPQTKIKYMTDGMLQREALNDPYMRKYSVIMLDEAHERTIATDVLFALLKQAARQNPNLKIIVTSATLDSDKFSRYFENCPVINIPGRTFPVEVMYTREPEMDYLAAALDSVIQIHVSEPQGDILVFLTGQEEIDTSCEVLYERVKTLGDTVADLIILPVYSSLPSEMQSKIFEPTPPNSRKVVLATNIAETSITIDGIYYVIDPGFVKINAYDAKLGMDSLMVSPISQAQANQRSGRAGRTGPGKCYRLYTESAFKNEMLPNTIPDIQRQNLSLTILMLKAMGIHDLLNFEFMDPPPPKTLVTALQELYTLNALNEDGNLTEIGRKMSDFPMQPALAKTLIISSEFGCSDEILTIVAMLSVQTVFYRPKEKQQLADQRKARFHNVNGDHLTLLGVYKAWSLHGYSKAWCTENFIHERSMRKAQEVRNQLATIMRRCNRPIVSCGANHTVVRRALCAGFFKHAAKREPQEGGYKTIVEQTSVSMHPSSSLFGKSPEYVVYHTLLLTTKEYMHCVTVIDAKWLVELAPTFFQLTDPSQLTDKKRKEKITPLYDKFNKDQNSWRLSAHHEAKKRALESLNQ